MSKLLSYLQALFKLTSSQSMPGNEYISFTQQMSPDSTFNWLAPTDGFITVSCPPMYIWLSVRTLWGEKYFDRFSFYANNGMFPCITMSCAKGQSVQIAVGPSSGNIGNEEVYIRYTSTVGAS